MGSRVNKTVHMAKVTDGSDSIAMLDEDKDDMILKKHFHLVIIMDTKDTAKAQRLVMC